jgi:hypothetical protein
MYIKKRGDSRIMPHFHKRIITPGDLTRYTVFYGLLTAEEDPRLNAIPGTEKIFFAFGQGDSPMAAFTFNRKDVPLEFFQGKFAVLQNQITVRMGWLVLCHVMGFSPPNPGQLGEFQFWYQKLRPGWADELPVLPLLHEKEPGER